MPYCKVVTANVFWRTLPYENLAFEKIVHLARVGGWSLPLVNAKHNITRKKRRYVACQQALFAIASDKSMLPSARNRRCTTTNCMDSCMTPQLRTTKDNLAKKRWKTHATKTQHAQPRHNIDRMESFVANNHLCAIFLIFDKKIKKTKENVRKCSNCSNCDISYHSWTKNKDARRARTARIATTACGLFPPLLIWLIAKVHGRLHVMSTSRVTKY